MFAAFVLALPLSNVNCVWCFASFFLSFFASHVSHVMCLFGSALHADVCGWFGAMSGHLTRHGQRRVELRALPREGRLQVVEIGPNHDIWDTPYQKNLFIYGVWRGVTHVLLLSWIVFGR